MPTSYGENKIYRMLDLFEQFSCGNVVYKQQIADRFHVTQKSIQRDISDLNEYLSLKTNIDSKIAYIPKDKGYRLLNRSNTALADSDVFALIKVLLESRAFSEPEMKRIITTFLSQCDDKESVKRAIQNELCYYVPPQHGQSIIDCIWQISLSIQHFQYISVKYKRQDGIIKEHRLKPCGLIASEYYFYLIADICGLEKNLQPFFELIVSKLTWSKQSILIILIETVLRKVNFISVFSLCIKVT